MFSSYRDFQRRTPGINKINMDETGIPGFILSPFKPKYLADSWVFIPTVLVAGIAVLLYKNEKPLSSAKEIMKFNKSCSPI